MHTWKINKLLFSGLVTFCMTSCEHSEKRVGEESSIAKTEPQTLRINIQGDPPSLHPHFGFDLNCRSLQKALFEGLTRISKAGRPEPALAAQIDVSKDSTIYTFTLRDSQWSNGENVTAYHFEKAWKDALTPGSKCTRSDLFYPIKYAEEAKKGIRRIEEIGIKAIDEKTLRVELEHPTPYFLDLVAIPLYSPLYDDAVNPQVFNGPYLVEKWDHEKSLVLVQNPKYWDASSVNIDKIVFTLVHDANTAFLMFESHELNWAGGTFSPIPLDALPNLTLHKLLKSTPVDGVYWFSLNTESFPLNSKYIRKALSFAINRDEVVKNVLGEIPTACLIPSFGAKKNGTDLALAKEYFAKGLKELNLTLETFPHLTFSHSDIAGQKQLAEEIAREWEIAFGIKINIQGYEWNTFFANLNEKRYQIGGCIWYSVFNDPIYTLGFFKDKSHCYNAPQWENSRYRELLELADSETDLAKRTAFLKEAELIILDETPVIPLFISSHKYVSQDNVNNIYISPTGIIDFKWAKITSTEIANK